MGKIGSPDSKKFAIGAAVAALAGFVTGVLTAPKSGKETREDIKNTTQKGITEAEKELKKLHTELSQLIEDVKGKKADVGQKASNDLNDLVEKAKNSKEKARDLLSALHEGGAEDKDLQKAIADATKAIEHIRTYLKK